MSIPLLTQAMLLSKTKSLAGIKKLLNRSLKNSKIRDYQISNSTPSSELSWPVLNAQDALGCYYHNPMLPNLSSLWPEVTARTSLSSKSHRCSASPGRDGTSQTGPEKLYSQRPSSGHLIQLRQGLGFLTEPEMAPRSSTVLSFP